MDKVAMITGATRGIGKQIALTLANEGYNIVLNYRTENDELIQAKNEIESKNVNCLTVQGDVTNFEDCKQMIESAINEFGKIDVLINNAGITKDMLLARMKEIKQANAIIAVAGMEGALPSVVGGLVDVPVIAVPTSVGYGANFGGLSALLTMLNSCASGISVVNIDNGFGAGYLASMINKLD